MIGKSFSNTFFEKPKRKDHMQSKFLFTFTLLLGVLFFSAFQERVDPEFDLVIKGGRVMDPESRLDAVRSIGIRNGSIAIISEEELNGREVLDASGLVVAPGFIDLHAHGQDPLSNRFQAADGVTTAMDLEAGVYPVAKWYASRQGQALINFGAVVGHGAARIKLMHDVEIGHSPTMSDGVRRQIEDYDRYREATEEEIEELVKLMRKGLEEGGLGFGFGIAYVPGATPQEILRLFQLAAENQVPAYVHLRAGGRDGAAATVAAFQEVIANAAIAGTSVHVVHLNSTAANLAQLCLEMIRGAQSRGLDVTTEAYPYTASSTRLESALFDNWRGDYHDIQWTETGERLDRETFEKYRRQGGWVIVHGRSEEINQWIVSQTDVIAASDGIPFIAGRAHPRGAGTFSRILGYYSRERKALSLMDALRKMTLLPARRVEGAAPQMAKKGRVQVGADADLTLFDPDEILDRATYEKPDQYSAGIVHVLVGGTFVVRDSTLVEGAAPGKPIRGRLMSGN